MLQNRPLFVFYLLFYLYNYLLYSTSHVSSDKSLSFKRCAIEMRASKFLLSLDHNCKRHHQSWPIVIICYCICSSSALLLLMFHFSLFFYCYRGLLYTLPLLLFWFWFAIRLYFIFIVICVVNSIKSLFIQFTNDNKSQSQNKAFISLYKNMKFIKIHREIRKFRYFGWIFGHFTQFVGIIFLQHSFLFDFASIEFIHSFIYWFLLFFIPSTQYFCNKYSIKHINKKLFSFSCSVSYR